MKSIMVKKIREEYGVNKIQGRKLELHNFYDLCGFYKKLKAGEPVK